LPTPPGQYVLAGDSYYGIRGVDITFTVPQNGWVSWGPGVLTSEPDFHDHVGIGFANVANLYPEPCHWHSTPVKYGSLGPSVDDLVDGLVAQPHFAASSATSVSLAGFGGRYVELSIDPGLDFSECDDQTVHSWLDTNGFSRYYQGPGQIERFWILDVGGTRVVIEGSMFPQASDSDRDQLSQIIDSLRFDLKNH
jgi:hypothetical protein